MSEPTFALICGFGLGVGFGIFLGGLIYHRLEWGSWPWSDLSD